LYYYTEMPKKLKSQSKANKKTQNDKQENDNDNESNNDMEIKDIQNIIKSAVAKKSKRQTKNNHDEALEKLMKDKGKGKDNSGESNIEVKQNDKDSSVVSDNDSVSDAFKYDNKKSKVITTKNTALASPTGRSTEENEDEKEEEDNEEIDYDNLSDEAKKEYMNTIIVDKVVKYIKFDDLIKQKQQEHKKEMKIIKDTKDELETFLIGYLDKVDEEFIQFGNENKTTLTKVEVKTKSPPKMEDIGTCLVAGFKKYEIYDNDDDVKRVVKDFIDTIDAKRETKTRKYLKRSKDDNNTKGKKNTKNKKETNGDTNNNNVEANNEEKVKRTRQSKKNEASPKLQKDN
jgi:hypothetical protein